MHYAGNIFRFFISLFSPNLKPFNPSTFKRNIMQELIDKLKTEACLTEEQAKKAIETIRNFVVEKFPMLEGAVGNLFAGS